jgi:BASS family bile acid:Na+ symporter
MFGIGLKVTRGDISDNLKNKPLMAKSLLANFVIIPLIGFVLLLLLPLERSDEIALMLLALTPGGLSALQFTTKSKDTGALGYSASLIFILSLLAIVVSPLLILIFIKGKYSLQVPYGEIAVLLLIMILLPLGAGIWLSENKQVLASKLAGPVSLIGTVAFFAIIIYSFSTAKYAKSIIEGRTVLVIFLFIVLSIITGWLLGGPEQEKRRILASSTCMRNFALCYLIVHATAPGMGIEFPLTAFASYMVPPNFLLMISYKIYTKRKAKKLSQKPEN